nr:unnamed protein product [Digitaria exilis]
MAAVASPFLRLHPRAAYPSAPASSPSPRCRFGSVAYYCSKAIPPPSPSSNTKQISRRLLLV